MDAEIFAALCAIEADNQSAQAGGSWTTGSGTGSDPDD